MVNRLNPTEFAPIPEENESIFSDCGPSLRVDPPSPIAPQHSSQEPNTSISKPPDLPVCGSEKEIEDIKSQIRASRLSLTEMNIPKPVTPTTCQPYLLALSSRSRHALPHSIENMSPRELPEEKPKLQIPEPSKPEIVPSDLAVTQKPRKIKASPLRQATDPLKLTTETLKFSNLPLKVLRFTRENPEDPFGLPNSDRGYPSSPPLELSSPIKRAASSFDPKKLISKLSPVKKQNNSKLQASIFSKISDPKSDPVPAESPIKMSFSRKVHSKPSEPPGSLSTP